MRKYNLPLDCKPKLPLLISKEMCDKQRGEILIMLWESMEEKKDRTGVLVV